MNEMRKLLNLMESALREPDHVMLYHGTHRDHVQSFLTHGARANWDREDLSRGAVFLSPRPDVAFAYAVMNGEAQYLIKGSRPKDVPDSERALIVFQVPREWYDQHLVREVDGSAPEVSFSDTVPAEFIVDVVVGDRQKVYSYMDQ